MNQLTTPAVFKRLSGTKTAQQHKAEVRCDNLRHYHIGPVRVCVQSDLPGIEEEFHEHYRSYEVSQAVPEEFLIEVRTRRSPLTLRRGYHILANGQESFVIKKKIAVLAHVEWAINNLIFKYLPTYYQIHAAVMSLNGIGVIFAGSPGSGKSTLAAGLLHRGWSYFSDEFALIDPATLLLNPYPKALCIKAGSFELLKGLGLPLDSSRIHQKGKKGPVNFLNPLTIRRDAVSEPCPVGLVIFPQYQAQATPSLKPISHAEAIFELASVSFNFNKFRAQGVQLLVEALGNAQCFRLQTGDLMESCELIESCLKNVTASEAWHAA